MEQEKLRRAVSDTIFIKLVAVFVLLALGLGQCVPAFAAAEEDGRKVVRVAYVLWENFQEGAEGEPKRGYGYEYLKKVSYYTGWKYEYVYGSFAELLQMLADGEIDLMGNISYTEERAQYISFSNDPQGDEYFYVYGYAGQTRIDRNDPATFNGTKVGVNAGSYQQKLFEQWCKENDVTCEIVGYSSLNQRVADLEAGVIDAVVGTDAYHSLNWMPLVQIGKEPYYFGVSKARNDLLVELNEAMSDIQVANPFYNDELRTKYFNSTSSVMSMLTDKELAWLEESPEITIGYLEHYLPYSDTDSVTGGMDGVAKELLDYIEEKYSLRYTGQAFSSYPEMLEALKNHEVDAIFPFYGDPGTAELVDLMVTDPVTTTTLTMYYSERATAERTSVAVDISDPFQMQFAQIHLPGVEQITCDGAKEAFAAVLRGDADYTMRETSRIEDRDLDRYTQELEKSALRDFVNVSFGVREGDVELLAVLNRGIGTVGDSFINNALVTHSRSVTQLTISDFLREYVIEAICVIILIFAVILGVIVAYYRSIAKSKEKLLKAHQLAEAARHEAEHDGLTGLFNRKMFENLKAGLEGSVCPFALVLLDADKFKAVNDTYGHDVGDKAIRKIASQMKLNFRCEDYLIRLGGDEFAAFLMDVTSADSMVIQRKIKRINKNLQSPVDGLPPLSVSAGVMFSKTGYSEALFQKADQALYQAKRNGGCSCIIASESIGE